MELVLHPRYARYEAVNSPNVQAAIGYLSMWGYIYPKVRISADETGYMEAQYFDAKDQCKYLIAGVWDENAKKYSFHS